jgi:hypothetical protein
MSLRAALWICVAFAAVSHHVGVLAMISLLTHANRPEGAYADRPSP